MTRAELENRLRELDRLEELAQERSQRESRQRILGDWHPKPAHQEAH
jgi:hypothetical protein